MKNTGFLVLVFLLVMCSSSNESVDVVETTTTIEINESVIDD